MDIETDATPTPRYSAEYSPLWDNRGMLEQFDLLQAVFESMLDEIRSFRELMQEPSGELGASLERGKS
jgi:hypothetical protein